MPRSRWSWRDARTGTTVSYARGVLSSTAEPELVAWLADHAPSFGWSPTGPLVQVPPHTEVEASGIAQLFLSDLNRHAVLVKKGNPPPTSELWLEPGEVEGDPVH